MESERIKKIQQINLKLLKQINSNLKKIDKDFGQDFHRLFNSVNQFWEMFDDRFKEIDAVKFKEIDVELTNFNDEIFELYDAKFLNSGFELQSIDEILLRMLMCATYFHQYENDDFRDNMFEFINFLEDKLK